MFGDRSISLGPLRRATPDVPAWPDAGLLTMLRWSPLDTHRERFWRNSRTAQQVRSVDRAGVSARRGCGPPRYFRARLEGIVNAMLEPITPGAPHEIEHPVMLQGWYDLTALHWRYEPAEVQALLPKGFVVDTFDGSAWVGLIPFHMRRIRLPGLPPFGPLSTFPETNVRTYIVDPTGRRGVFFLSLDITRLLPTVVARLGYRLPYCWSTMSIHADGHGEGSTRRYQSQRRWPRGGPTSQVTVRIGRQIAGRDLTELDHFLTARWALGTTFGRRLMWAEVDHPPWPIHFAELLGCDESLIEAAGLGQPRGESIVRWSPGVEVRIGIPRSIRRSNLR